MGSETGSNFAREQNHVARTYSPLRTRDAICRPQDEEEGSSCGVWSIYERMAISSSVITGTINQS